MPKRTWLCAGILWSGMLYRPSKSLKRRGKSSSLHSKKIFLLGGCSFFMSDVISGGLLVSHKKSAPPNQKNFFQVQSTRLADPFEPLNSFSCTIGGGARALVSQLKTAVF